jgi:quaternary ammonium compound-resistance protein SugE
MSWILLLLASLFEIAWAIGLKYTEGFTRLWPSVITIACLLASVSLLGLATRTLPIGTAYAVWTGIGAAGTVLCGVLLLGDPASLTRFICVALILAGVVGLKLA